MLECQRKLNIQNRLKIDKKMVMFTMMIKVGENITHITSTRHSIN
jgi:hypothetical protein